MARKSGRKSSKKKGVVDPAEDHDTVDNMDLLPEEYTIADSETNSLSLLDDDLFDGDSLDDDDLIGGKGRPLNAEAVEAAALSRLQKLQETLSSIEDLLTEKRSAKRESGLRRLFRSLTHYATGVSGQDMVYTNQNLIQQVAFHGLRVGQPTEQYSACRIIEATSVILGGDQEEWVEGVQKTLTRIITSNAKAVAIRAAALRALAMAITICSDDSHDTEHCMDLCEQVAAQEFRNEPVNPALRATALHCWALLASTLDDFYLSGQDDVSTGRGIGLLPVIQECLESTHMDLRAAAGECMALIHEARLELGLLEHDNDADEVINATARQYQRGTWENSQWEDIMEDIKQRISDLSTQSGHHISKKAKKIQRSTFRDIMATVVDDEAPEEVINFRATGCLTLNTWKEITQLNFVRHCLQGGFQIQLLTNRTLQAMLGADSQALNDVAGNMSQLEKRLLLSKGSEASKAADQKLTKERRKRNNVKNHFLTADGDYY